MTPGVADPEYLMRMTRRAHSREVKSPERMEATRALSDREDTLVTLSNRVVSEEHPTKEESPMCAEGTENVSHEIKRDDIVYILGFVEDAATASVTLEGQMES